MWCSDYVYSRDSLTLFAINALLLFLKTLWNLNPFAWTLPREVSVQGGSAAAWFKFQQKWCGCFLARKQRNFCVCTWWKSFLPLWSWGYKSVGLTASCFFLLTVTMVHINFSVFMTSKHQTYKLQNVLIASSSARAMKHQVQLSSYEWLLSAEPGWDFKCRSEELWHRDRVVRRLISRLWVCGPETFHEHDVFPSSLCGQ